MLGVVWRGLLAFLLAGFLAACADTPPPVSHARPTGEGLAACLSKLDQFHVQYDRVQDWSTPEGCGVQGAIRLRHDEVEWSRPLVMTCALESALDDYERQVLEPAARKYFHHGLHRITNAGTYNCRAERSEHSNRLSQHAFGKAIDITGFELDDGTTISVRRDWLGSGEKAQFLREAARGACHHFSVVLTPNYNAFHQDHLHLDIGPHKLCGM